MPTRYFSDWTSTTLDGLQSWDMDGDGVIRSEKRMSGIFVVKSVSVAAVMMIVFWLIWRMVARTRVVTAG